MKKHLKKRRYKIFFSFLLVLIIIYATMKIIVIYETNKIMKMNSVELIEDYCSNKDDIVLTVGIIYDGEMKYIVYDAKGEVLPKKEYEYEIGSITKTFTTSLLSKAIFEGEINLDDSISEYMEIEEGNYYPTIKELSTHTSGYGIYPLSTWFKEVKCFFGYPDNPFYGIDVQELTERVQEKKLSDKEYDYKYSNFGISVLGNVLSNVYGESFQPLMNDFIRNELGLLNTYVGIEKAALNGYTKSGKTGNWEWESDNAYLPAGSIISDIGDMLRYAEIQMSQEQENEYFSISHQEYSKTSIPGSSIGLAWFIDKENNIIWHSGGTSGFNTFLGFDKKSETAVVVLANYQCQNFKNSTNIGYEILKELQKGSNLIFNN